MSTPIEAHEAHNRVSLDALLRHIEEQCRERVGSIQRHAAEQAEAIQRSARRQAAELLRETRRRERRLASERLRTERARQEARIRQKQLALQQQRAQRGVEALRESLVALWKQPAARAAWLVRALNDARAVLPGDAWRVLHPDDWAPDAEADRAAAHAAAGVRIEWACEPALRQGFIVEAARARVDATIAGLTARSDRIAGVLLAELPDPDPEVAA
jgi:vacuolar-type H+-ATPase subunit E/Vma4